MCGWRARGKPRWPPAGVSIAAAFFWTFELAVPVQASTIAGASALGVTFASPYVVDRLVAPRLSPWPALLVFPAARTACEFLVASFSPLGAAYGLSAVTQSDNLPLLQVTALVGPYAIGFLIGGFAVVANRVLDAPARRSARGPVIAYAALRGVVLIGGSPRLGFFPSAGPYTRVAGISPSSVAAQAEARLLGGQPRTPDDVRWLDPARVEAAFGGRSDAMFADTERLAPAPAPCRRRRRRSAGLRTSSATTPIFRRSPGRRAPTSCWRQAATGPRWAQRTR